MESLVTREGFSFPVGPALGTLGGGYARPETADTSEDKLVHRARGHLNAAFIKASKIAKRSPERAEATRRKAYEQYEKVVARAQARAKRPSYAGATHRAPGVGDVVEKPPGM